MKAMPSVDIGDPDLVTLTSTERRALRARAHHLRPVVVIGTAGLTAQVVKEIDASLKSHELIKVRALDEDRSGRERLLSEICAATGAAAVQTLGKVLVLYRPRPPEEEKKAPKRRPKPKAPRKTKRSYQKGP